MQVQGGTALDVRQEAAVTPAEKRLLEAAVKFGPDSAIGVVEYRDARDAVLRERLPPDHASRLREAHAALLRATEDWNVIFSEVSEAIGHDAAKRILCDK